jgi:hypothetical protein
VEDNCHTSMKSFASPIAPTRASAFAGHRRLEPALVQDEALSFAGVAAWSLLSLAGEEGEAS